MMKPYRHALVCGLGGSGESAALLLAAEGTTVTAVDASDTPALRSLAVALSARGVHVELGATTAPPEDFDICVTSPGVPPHSPLLIEMRRRGVPVISELELGWSRRRCRVVAITGSNGKSTAVKWFVESLRQAGRKAEPAGNYGPPICRVVRESPELDWLVLEVSTFQLETVDAFRPDVGILLNINPNHLDRHGTMEVYRRLKARMFRRAQDGDACIVREEILDEVRGNSGGKGRWISFGVGHGADFRFADGIVWCGADRVADLRGTTFDNDVLGAAGAAVVAGLRACGVDSEYAEKAARAFQPLAHRLQPVGEVRGVRFVNDSKATNLSAMAAALRVIPAKIRLIAGGLVKEADFSFVKELLVKKVLGVYLIGQASEEMASAWSGSVSCFPCETLDVAFRRAAADAGPGEVVLLSPACASFDQFRNYEERGDVFASLVKDLAENRSV